MLTIKNKNVADAADDKKSADNHLESDPPLTPEEFKRINKSPSLSPLKKSILHPEGPDALLLPKSKEPLPPIKDKNSRLFNSDEVIAPRTARIASISAFPTHRRQGFAVEVFVPPPFELPGTVVTLDASTGVILKDMTAQNIRLDLSINPNIRAVKEPTPSGTPLASSLNAEPLTSPTPRNYNNQISETTSFGSSSLHSTITFSSAATSSTITTQQNEPIRITTPTPVLTGAVFFKRASNPELRRRSQSPPLPTQAVTSNATAAQPNEKKEEKKAKKKRTCDCLRTCLEDIGNAIASLKP